MKRLFVCLIAFMMTLSLAACGGGTEPVQGTETSAPPAEETQSAESEPAMSTEPEIEEPAETVVYTLDTVPKPTMGGQAGEDIGEDYAEYVSRNASYQSLTDYEALLTDEGFTVEVTKLRSDLYRSVATNANARIDITFETADWDLTDPEALADGAAGLDTSVFAVYITVEEVEDPAASDRPENMEALIPALPEGSWSSSDFDNDGWYFHHVYCSQLTVEDVEAYVQTLQNGGYDKNVVIGPSGADGEIYRFEGYGHGSPLTMVTVTVTETGQETAPLYTTVSVAVQRG